MCEAFGLSNRADHGTSLTSAHDGRRKVRSDVRTVLAASGADEARLDVGQTHMIGPTIRAERRRVTALVVGAVDDHFVHSGFAHLAERYLLLGGRHDRYLCDRPPLGQ